MRDVTNLQLISDNYNSINTISTLYSMFTRVLRDQHFFINLFQRITRHLRLNTYKLKSLKTHSYHHLHSHNTKLKKTAVLLLKRNQNNMLQNL